MRPTYLTPKIEVAIWAEPAQGTGLSELVTQLRALNYDVLEVDRLHRRVKVVVVHG